MYASGFNMHDVLLVRRQRACFAPVGIHYLSELAKTKRTRIEQGIQKEGFKEVETRLNSTND